MSPSVLQKFHFLSCSLSVQCIQNLSDQLQKISFHSLSWWLWFRWPIDRSFGMQSFFGVPKIQTRLKSSIHQNDQIDQNDRNPITLKVGHNWGIEQELPIADQSSREKCRLWFWNHAWFPGTFGPGWGKVPVWSLVRFLSIQFLKWRWNHRTFWDILGHIWIYLRFPNSSNSWVEIMVGSMSKVWLVPASTTPPWHVLKMSSWKST